MDLTLVNFDVGPASGERSCQVEHVGLVLSGPYVSLHFMGSEDYAS